MIRFSGITKNKNRKGCKVYLKDGAIKHMLSEISAKIIFHRDEIRKLSKFRTGIIREARLSGMMGKDIVVKPKKTNVMKEVAREKMRLVMAHARKHHELRMAKEKSYHAAAERLVDEIDDLKTRIEAFN